MRKLVTGIIIGLGVSALAGMVNVYGTEKLIVNDKKYTEDTVISV